MSLKIGTAWVMDGTDRMIPAQAIRLDELRRWLEGHQIILSQAGPDLRGEYVNLTIQAMLAELKEAQP